MPALQVNVEDIRRSFYDQFAQGDRWWWWDRELLADPWEFIASDENGDLHRVPFEVGEDENGDTVVSSWGDPKPIKINYVDDPSREGDAVEAARTLLAPRLEGAGRVLAMNTKKPDRTTGRQKEAKPAMGIDIKSVRKITGLSETDLPDDASEEQINDALAAAAEDEGDEETAETEGSETKPSEQPGPGDNEVTEPDAIAASGGRVVDAEAWAETQRYVGKMKTKERTDLVEAAVTARKIPPSRKAHYLSLAEKDFEGTKKFLEGLEANAVPGDESGHSEGEVLEGNRSGRGTGLFPDLDAQRAAREEATA